MEVKMPSNYGEDFLKSIFIIIIGIIVLGAIGTEIAKQMSAQLGFLGGLIIFIGVVYLIIKLIDKLH